VNGGKGEFADLITEFSDVFSEPTKPFERDIKHRIDLIDELAMPPRRRVYRMSQPELAECRR
jgi:hypothetical protein